MIDIIAAAIIATAPSTQASVPAPIATEGQALTSTTAQRALIRARNSKAIASASTIPAEWRSFADCVATRESHHNPKALNKGSGAAGKWQFMPAWRNGLPYMVAERLADHGATPLLVRRLLASAKELPVNKWKEHYQDIGFVAVITSTKGQGWKHWYLAGSRCNRLVPGKAS